MNKITTKVSVVVPVYNAEKYLGECIDSILDQTYKEFELILVDDGSNDASGKICDDYALRDSRIMVFHQRNEGVTSARQKGVLESQSEWIMFVDADDKLETDGLEILIRVMNQDTKVDIIEGSYCCFFPDNTIKLRQNTAILSKNPVYDDGHDYSMSLCQEYGAFRGPVAKLIRKEVLLNSNAFDIPRWITNREDTMMLTIAAHYCRKHVLISESVYLYRQQFGKSAIDNKKTLDYWSEYLKYFEENAIRDKYTDWRDVFEYTVINVFSLIVHGGNIKSGYAPIYFREIVLPVLNKRINDLHKVDQIYTRLLVWPAIVRYPICIVLHALFVIKRSLLGKFFALRSRR